LSKLGTAPLNPMSWPAVGGADAREAVAGEAVVGELVNGSVVTGPTAAGSAGAVWEANATTVAARVRWKNAI